MVHPRPPKRRQRRIRHDEPTERDNEQEENGHQNGSQELVGRKRRNGLPEPDIKHLEKHEQQPRIRRTCSRSIRPHAPEPPATKVNRARHHRIRQLHQHRAEREREPRVNLAVALAGLEDLPSGEEFGLELLD